jgi:hypothetical protein
MVAGAAILGLVWGLIAAACEWRHGARSALEIAAFMALVGFLVTLFVMTFFPPDDAPPPCIRLPAIYGC